MSRDHMMSRDHILTSRDITERGWGLMGTSRGATGRVGRVQRSAALSRQLHAGEVERRRGRLLMVASAGLVTVLLSAVDLVDLGFATVNQAMAGTPTGESGPAPGTDGGSALGDGCRRLLGGPCADTGTGLISYVAESGLRFGVLLAVLLVAVPLAIFGVQVLRLGTAARERRLAALSLAGATRADLGLLAGLEAARWSGRGALAGLPGVFLLWLLLGVAPPAGFRLLPAPSLLLPLSWPVVSLAVVAGAVIAATAAARPAAAHPLGPARRIRRPLGVAAAVAPVTFLAVFVAAAVGMVGNGPDPVALALPLSLVGMAIGLGPWLVLAIGRWAVRRRTLVTTLAGHRLVADPRTPGRIAGVLLAVGMAVGLAAASAGNTVDAFGSGGTDSERMAFYLGGHGLALAGVGLAAAVAAASLVVGAAESVLDARRPTAALAAMGVPTGVLRAVLRRQLSVVASVPSVVGAVVGWALWCRPQLAMIQGERPGWATVAGLPAAVVVCALGARAGSWVAARALRSTLDAATDPANLRSA